MSWPDPAPSAGEVLIRVQAAGVNRADLLQRKGRYPPPAGASELLGLECAGVVVAAGAGVSRHKVGDAVMALLPGGGYAELAVAHEGCVLPLPAGWSMALGAAFPEVFTTAYLNLVELGGLGPGQWVLVHGGTSGVGTAALALARRMGAHVVATVGNEAKRAACHADAVVNYATEDFVTAARAATKGAGVPVILDCVGASYLERHLDALATDGRLVVIGLQGGRSAPLDLAKLLQKRLHVVGSTLRARTEADKAGIMRRLVQRFGPVNALPEPTLDRVVAFAEVEQAHARMRAGEHVGKLVLEGW